MQTNYYNQAPTPTNHSFFSGSPVSENADVSNCCQDHCFFKVVEIAQNLALEGFGANVPVEEQTLNHHQYQLQGRSPGDVEHEPEELDSPHDVKPEVPPMDVCSLLQLKEHVAPLPVETLVPHVAVRELVKKQQQAWN